MFVQARLGNAYLGRYFVHGHEVIAFGGQYAVNDRQDGIFPCLKLLLTKRRPLYNSRLHSRGRSFDKRADGHKQLNNIHELDLFLDDLETFFLAELALEASLAASVNFVFTDFSALGSNSNTTFSALGSQLK